MHWTRLKHAPVCVIVGKGPTAGQAYQKWGAVSHYERDVWTLNDAYHDGFSTTHLNVHPPHVMVRQGMREVTVPIVCVKSGARGHFELHRIVEALEGPGNNAMPTVDHYRRIADPDFTGYAPMTDVEWLASATPNVDKAMGQVRCPWCGLHPEQFWRDPANVLFPRHEINKRYHSDYFAVTTAYMLACAILLGYEEIHMYGLDMWTEIPADQHDRIARDLGVEKAAEVIARQNQQLIRLETPWERPCVEAWIAVGWAKGIEIPIPGQSLLMRTGPTLRAPYHEWCGNQAIGADRRVPGIGLSLGRVMQEGD